MWHFRMAALAAAVAVVIATLSAARPVAATDLLYLGDSAGTTGVGDSAECDNVAWRSYRYQLWYILDWAHGLWIDIPTPDLTPETSVRIDLEPVVVGTLNGTVTLAGPNTISDVIVASSQYGEPVWGRFAAPAEFVLTFTPGTPTTGELPVPDKFADRWAGFAAVRATITTTLLPNTAMATDAGSGADMADGMAQQTIVILAQGFKTCDAPEPTLEPTPEPSPSPTAHSSASTDALAADRGDPGVAPAASIALATSLLMLGLVMGRALRRRR